MLRVQSLLKDAHGNLGAENALVRSIITTVNGRIYTVGYDRQLRMWDTDATRTIASVLSTRKRARARGSRTRRSAACATASWAMNDPERECHDAPSPRWPSTLTTTGS